MSKQDDESLLRRFVHVALIVLTLLTSSCSKAPGFKEPTHGESTLDRTSHVELKLLTEIPETFRWCGRIEGLDKRRINVGDAELYVGVEGKGTLLVLIHRGPGGTHHYFHPWFSRLRKNATVVYCVRIERLIALTQQSKVHSDNRA